MDVAGIHFSIVPTQVRYENDLLCHPKLVDGNNIDMLLRHICIFTTVAKRATKSTVYLSVFF